MALPQKFKQGDILLVPFPFSDLSANKVRPVIVLSNDKINNTSDLICAQITSNHRNDQFSFVLDEKELSNSLRTPSEVRCNKVFTADQNIVQKKISSLSKDKQKDLFTKVAEFLKA